MKRTTRITKIELAETDKIDLFREYVDKVLKALGHPEALVTNESQVWDFTVSDKAKLKRVSKKLGFDVNERDYIWELAERCKAQKQN